MLKRRPIDTYIRRATAGLPRLERVDTAAEIRVHLLQKTRELMTQGFPREEAEHLAVQEMGPVAATNRALLGHTFTSSLGWAVVGVMLAGAGIWTYLERDWIFWKDTTIRSVQLDSDDLQFALQLIPQFVVPPDFKKFEFFVPRGTKTVEYAMVSRFAHRSDVVFSLDEVTKDCADQRAARECANQIGFLDRIPFKISVVLGEGKLKERDLSKTSTSTLETDGQTTSPEQAMVHKVIVTPNLTGISSWSMNPNVWSRILQPPNTNVFKMGSTTSPDTTLRLNEWTAFWSKTLGKRSLKKVRLSGDSFYWTPKEPDDLASIDQVSIAIRASDKTIKEFRSQALRVPIGGSLGVVETDIKKSEMSCRNEGGESIWTCYSEDLGFHNGHHGGFGQ
jgi:hypothetical protein